GAGDPPARGQYRRGAGCRPERRRRGGRRSGCDPSGRGRGRRAPRPPGGAGTVDPLSPLPAPLESWRPPLPGSTRPRNRQEAEEVARELEAIFLGELLKSLEATLPSGSLLGGGGSPI